ncbi:esterase/lipase family protein [Hahella ganghwensis]|uniref:esterase/lipase family protein n=1 Tax=Hahella ganghwensis TaxID=286420 RepID=UPI00036D3661|nr:alpha/beta fold hydrolase [Hahella ganghwensis]
MKNTAVPAPSDEVVILLHGLARTHRSLSKLEQQLHKAGYTVINQGYPSRKYPIQFLAENFVKPAVIQSRHAHRIHFVTHSMGGILVREYLSHHLPENLGRVVMMAPPNQGSQVVDRLGKYPGFRYFNGPAGLQLGTGNESIPNKLPEVSYETGIIAGNKTINFLLSTLLPGDNDGKVTVTSTRVKGMKDHITLPVNHPLMMNNDEVISEITHFLNNGLFRHHQP